jgi:hypothetical protein
MSHCFSIRALRQALLAQSTTSSVDEVEIETLRQEIARTVQEIRQSMNRALDFASRGLVGEAAALAEDFPDLAGEASALTGLPSSDPTIARVWSRCVDPNGPLAWILEAMPRESEIDAIAMQSARVAEMKVLLDAHRSAALRQESIVPRLKVLRKLRIEDENNRMWLDQIQTLETEWLKWAVERSRASAPTRDELEGILSALSGHEWLASIPRGLKEDVYARLKPMRAETAGQRYAEIAERVHAAASNLDWDEIRRLEAEWAGIYHDTGRMPDDALQAQVQVPFDALTSRESERRRSMEFQSLCDALDRELDLHPASARSPNEPAIEQALQAVRDFGLPAPEGLVERAIAHLDSIAEARRRRSRIMLVSAVSSAAVVLLALAVGIRVQSLRAAEQSARTTLREHVEAKRWSDAQALADEIRASYDSPHPETAAVLKKHDEGFTAWSVRQEVVESELAEARTRLGIEPADPEVQVDRADHTAITDRIGSIRSDIETERHRAWVKQVDERLASVLIGLDAADRTRADQALSACEQSLKDWKSPDQWTPVQRIDVKRWADYQKSLESAARGLVEARGSLKGFPDGEADLTRRLEGVEAGVREAQARQSTLVEAERLLAPDGIGKPVSLEADFLIRLDDARKRFGDVLAVRGQLADWESASALANAWLALQDWRDVRWASLSAALKGDFAAVPMPDSAAAAVAILDEHLGAHPETPIRSGIEELKARLEPGQMRNLWAGADLRAALEAERLAGIERVEIVKTKGRYFFRRAYEKNSRSVNNAIQTLEDLNRQPMSDLDIQMQISGKKVFGKDYLSSIQLKPEEMAGVPRPDPISLIWDDIQFHAGPGNQEEVAGRILDLIRRIRQERDADAFLQLYALMKSVRMLQDSGHMSPVLKPSLDAWNEKLRTEWLGAASMDWARAAVLGPLLSQKEREQAANALKGFPDIDRLLREAGESKAKVVASLGPFAPIGVLLPADEQGIRRLRDTKISGEMVLVRAVAGKPGSFELILARCDSGLIETAGLGVPKGPILVFRRIVR